MPTPLAASPLATSPVATAAADLPALNKTLSDSWQGQGGDAALTALTTATSAIQQLATDDGTLQTALKEGITKVVAAAKDVFRIGTNAFQAAAKAVSAAIAAGPFGWLTAAGQVAGIISQAFTDIKNRLSQLAEELSSPTKTLNGLASHNSDQVRNNALPPGANSSTSPQQANYTGDIADNSNDGDGAPTPQAKKAVQKALSAVGTPYVWGGNTPGVGLDCSGLTHWAYGEAGVDIPRTAQAQTVGRQVSASNLLPGDLLVWDGHVAMYTGNGQIVEAGSPVQTNPIRTTNMGMNFLGYWRPTG